ncbi:MAG TPA: DUF3999 family protein, partial [Candidatus Polarisedimenticolia bacterium]|nr:DUF3999 family protein [Candidatus Polarisedimenticolia bacterium]
IYRIPPLAGGGAAGGSAAGGSAAAGAGTAPRFPPDGSSAAGARLEQVRLPDNDLRRLRVTVFPMPDEKGPVDLREVRAHRETITEAETTPLKIISLKRTEDTRTKTSAFEMDLGYRHARVALLEFDFEDEAFRRSYELFSRDSETLRLPGGLTETGEPITTTFPAPWRPAVYGTFYRVPVGRAGEKAIDETRIALSDAEARYLRLVVHDQDDRPLRLRDVKAWALVERVVFPVRPGGAYSLYYGNPLAPRPAYDLPAVLPDLDAHPAAVATLGPQRPNPLRAGAPPPPFSERHPWVLWVALLSGVAVLALLVLRSARGLSRASHT